MKTTSAPIETPTKTHQRHTLHQEPRTTRTGIPDFLPFPGDRDLLSAPELSAPEAEPSTGIGACAGTDAGAAPLALGAWFSPTDADADAEGAASKSCEEVKFELLEPRRLFLSAPHVCRNEFKRQTPHFHKQVHSFITRKMEKEVAI
jgi:hypothetical protein